jgi:hypothetical protein
MKKILSILGLAHGLVSLARDIVRLANEFMALIANYGFPNRYEKLYSPI